MAASVSLKEIASAVGVSITTVVRALKGQREISEETREKILKVAREMNYRPNFLARGLVTNRSYTLGAIVPDLLNPFFPELIKGIEETAWRQGYNVILADADYDLTKEEQIIEAFISRMVDGIIISPIESRPDCSGLNTLMKSGIPFVSLSKVPGLESDLVVVDDSAGAYEAVKHLARIGRKRILYMGSSSSPRAHAERLEGYQKGLREMKLDFDETMVLMANQKEVDSGYRVIGEYFRQNRSFDAIIAFNDLMAMGIQRAVREAGLSVPDDIALIGFDDIKISSLLEVPLTTVSLPKYALGEESARLVMKRIEQSAAAKVIDGEKRAVVHLEKIVLHPSLIVRKSCGAP